MWPVSDLIGETGGLFFHRNADSQGLKRIFWHADKDRRAVADRLAAIRVKVLEELPTAKLADDQPFRLTSVAFAQPKIRTSRRQS